MEKSILENQSLSGQQPGLKDSFDRVVRQRRSVRIYDGKPVPEQVIKDALENALLAPNSSNMQPWEFYWVRSPEKKKKMVEYCLGQNAASTASEIVVVVGRIDRTTKHRKQMLEILRSLKAHKNFLAYYEKIVPFVYAAGFLSILAPVKWLIYTVMGLFKPIVREPLGKSDLRLWAAKTTALACENFMLSITASGYDTCPMEGLDSKRVKKLLGLPSSSVVVMAISVGKRKDEGIWGERIRFPSEQFIHIV